EVEEEVHGLDAGLRTGDGRAGGRRVRDRGQRAVVDADDADLRPDADAALGEAGHDAERDEVVVGDDGGRGGRVDEVGGPGARLDLRLEGTELDELDVVLRAGLPDRGLPLGVGPRALGAVEVADRAVTEG